MTGAPDSGTWSRMSKAAALDRRLSAEAFRVLGVLGCYADATARCHPSIPTIAARLGLGHRVVQYHLRRLEALGYVLTVRQPRRGSDGRRKNGTRLGGGWAPNVYQLCFPTPPSLATTTPDKVQPHCTPPRSNGADKVQPDCTMSNTDKVQSDDTDKVQSHCI
jgi:DNA-binding transcriptional ArsR family regulator